MTKNGVLQAIISAVLLLVAIATLGVSIAILVTIINNKNDKNNENHSNTVHKLNIPLPQQIPTGSVNYNGYKGVVELFKSSLNTTVSPCEDFYQYTCGNFNQSMSFDVSDQENVNNMVEQMINLTYVNSSPNPVKQVSWYFLQCVNARLKWTSLVKSGDFVMDAIKRVAAGDPTALNETQFPFYMLYQNETVKSFPDSVGLGSLLGYTAGGEGAPNLVTPYTDTNWKDPHGKNGYAFFIDQPSTLVPHTYHSKAWGFFEKWLLGRIMNTMNVLATTQNISLNQKELLMDAMDIVQLDHVLAMEYSTDDTTRRQYERSYNPMTIDQLTLAYPKINWYSFIQEAMVSAPHVFQELLKDPYYQFVVMEPAKLKKLNDVIGNQAFVSSRTIINYIYYHVVDRYSEYLPWSQASLQSAELFYLERPLVGRPRRIRIEKRKYERRQHDDTREAQQSCAMETVSTMPYANARVFIDKIFPTNDSRLQLRSHVAKVVSSILIGFRSMIDQLSWMSSATKKGAYSKLDHLVKNIAYPDWIADDLQFSAYYKDIRIEVNQDDYFTIMYKIQEFNAYSTWSVLVAGPTDRRSFNGPPGTTNAWYQAELNSITFPAAILHRPFYDPTWPMAVSFGGLGVIAGHELTHGFDDQGVQWDGTGVLSGWMDDASKAAFGTMAECVVTEYNNFCPLNKTAYGKAACLDGAQTQGENIADNGGIHAAFRAYRNFINLYGPDPQLPDDELQEFSSDQLFFLSFARVWCQQPVSAMSEELQILVDPHSPSKFRVLGTIQNFPAFKDAFHCPSSTYAPDKHCNVWVSDIDSSYGEPVVKSELNIQSKEQITTSDFEKYNAYRQAVSFYQPSVNTSADPCSDFWQYACGNYNKSVSFHFADARNLRIVAGQLNNPSYQKTIKASTALTKEKTFWDACVAATWNTSTSEGILVSKNYLKPRVDQLATFLGSNFTYAFGGDVQKLPTNTQLAYALSYLSFNQGIDTLVTPYVDTNWADPTKGYRMFLDQNTAYMSKTYYIPNAFKTFEDIYVKSATAVIARFMREQGVPADPHLNDKIRGLIEFEQMIANTFSTDDSTRRKYARSWNLMNMDDLQKKYTFVDWKTYFGQVPEVAQSVVQQANFEVSVSEPGQFAKMSSAFANFNKTKLVNYLFMRLLLQNAQYLPTYSSSLKEMPEERLRLGRKRRGFRFLDTSDTLEDIQASCVDMANTLMQFANGRVFIDYLYPDDKSKKMIRDAAGGVIQNVIHSFQGMIDQLDWMSTDTKKKAYEKTASIVQNIAFPDWITDNEQLDAYYKSLTFNSLTQNYYDMWTLLTKFNVELHYKQLTADKTDRHDFLGQPSTVNAWYQPELNSITFPAGILQPPYFHPQWPASINYGGIGLVAGHELTHGFDDEGVQWGPGGEITFPSCINCTGWMDQQSTAGFNSVAHCIIDEYSNFCPLDAAKYTPNCVNGAQTQGENIADNGGVHSAFRAYRTHIALDGPDPLLPDRLFGQFTHDQLFFLNFAQVWCEKRETDDDLYRQLMVDPHSPASFRVFGTIQNYPAFRVAYNCPANSIYAPTQHCSVWVPTFDP